MSKKYMNTLDFYGYRENNMMESTFDSSYTVSVSDKDGNIITIEKGNSLYACVKLAFDTNTGILSLLDAAHNDSVLAEVEMPNADYIYNCRFDEEKNAILFDVKSLYGDNTDTIELDVESLVELYEAGQGIEIGEKSEETGRRPINVKLAEENGLLTLTDEGLGIDGKVVTEDELDAAISGKADAEWVEEILSGLTGVTEIIELVEEHEDEIEKLKKIVGTEEEVPSLFEQIESNREDVSELDGEIGEISGVVGTIENNLSTIVGDVELLKDKLDEEVARTISAETELNEKLCEEIEARKSGSVVSADYDSTEKLIIFYNANDEVIDSIDATAFIKDGMVDSVELVKISGSTYLRIVFNTDAGKDDLYINIGDIFNTDNYYTKSEINELKDEIITIISDDEETVAVALGDLNVRKLDISAYTPADFSNYYTKGQVDTKVSDINNSISAVQRSVTNLDFKKLDASAYTPTDLSDYYTKEETNNKLSKKLDTSAYTPTDLSDYYTKEDVNYKLSEKLDTSAYTPVDLSDYYTKENVNDIIIENEEIISAALNDLKHSKLDSSAYTPVDLSDYYTKEDVNAIIIDDEEVISSALNDLKSNKLDISAYTPVDLSDYYTKEETNDELDNKLDISAYTPTDLSNYYTKEDTSASTEISDALEEKVNYQEYISHAINSDLHFNGSEKENLDSLEANITAISGISSTNVGNWNDAYDKKHIHDNKSYIDSISGNVGTMAYESTNTYSSATQVNTALSDKADISAVTEAISNITITSNAVISMGNYIIAESGTPIADSDTLNQAIGKLEKMIEELKLYINSIKDIIIDNEEITAASLNELDNRIKLLEE